MNAANAQAARISRTLFLLWGLFWLLMVLVAIQDYARSDGQYFWQPVLWELSSASIATVWLWLQRRVDAHYAPLLARPARWFAQHLLWLPLVAATLIPGMYGVRHVIYGLLGHTYEHESWLLIVIYESIKLMVFAGLWLGVIFGLNSFAQWEQQQARMLSLQKSLTEAQLARLRSQLHPHFLFNALNTISALMQTDVNRADRLLVRLSDLLRSALQSEQREFHSVDEELRLLQLYADIMVERYRERVVLEWEIDDAARSCVMPVMLLQPLLENAFKHGVDCHRGQSHIAVAVKLTSAKLHLSIRNSPVGEESQPGTGTGLNNIRERLAVMYEGAATLTLERRDEEMIAALELPERSA